MSDYSANITITVPIAQRETGKRISRALDADTGGYLAYSQGLDADMQPCSIETAVYVTYSSPCSQELAGSMSYLIANPDVLHGMVAADYVLRWDGFEVPTVAEISSFCNAVLPIIGNDQENHIQQP